MIPPPGVAPYVHHTRIVRALLERAGIKRDWPGFAEAERRDAAPAAEVVTPAPSKPARSPSARPYPPPAAKPLRKAAPKAKKQG